jgi:hypothetical protein
MRCELNELIRVALLLSPRVLRETIYQVLQETIYQTRSQSATGYKWVELAPIPGRADGVRCVRPPGVMAGEVSRRGVRDVNDGQASWRCKAGHQRASRCTRRDRALPPGAPRVARAGALGDGRELVVRDRLRSSLQAGRPRKGDTRTSRCALRA